MKVRALRSHPYAGDHYKRGEEYEISKLKDLKVMLAVKAVELAEKGEPIEEVSLPVAQRDRDEEVVEEPKPQKRKRGRPRNSYSRRDMRADGGEPDAFVSEE